MAPLLETYFKQLQKYIAHAPYYPSTGWIAQSHPTLAIFLQSHHPEKHGLALCTIGSALPPRQAVFAPAAEVAALGLLVGVAFKALQDVVGGDAQLGGAAGGGY